MSRAGLPATYAVLRFRTIYEGILNKTPPLLLSLHFLQAASWNENFQQYTYMDIRTTAYRMLSPTILHRLHNLNPLALKMDI